MRGHNAYGLQARFPTTRKEYTSRRFDNMGDRSARHLHGASKGKHGHGHFFNKKVFNKAGLAEPSERSCETGKRRRALFVDIEIPHSTWRVERDRTVGRRSLLCLTVYVPIVDSRRQGRHTHFLPSLAAHIEVVCGGGEFGRSSLHFAHVRAPRFRHGAPLICACLPCAHHRLRHAILNYAIP